MKAQQHLQEKQSLSVKVLKMYVAGFLDPNMTTSHVITVFDIVEHNNDGKSRLQRLIEEELTIKLTAQQVTEATQLLED